MARTFGDDFQRLTRAFGRHQGVPREPDRYDELAATRIELDDARSDVRSHGRRFRTRPENSNFVEPGRDRIGASLAGRIAVLAAAAFVVAGVFLGVRALQRIGASPVEFVGSTSETFSMSTGGRCVWTVAGDIRNDSSVDFKLEEAAVVTADGNAVLLGGVRFFPPGVTADVKIEMLLPQTECPTSIDDVSSGRIVLNEQHSIRP